MLEHTRQKRRKAPFESNASMDPARSIELLGLCMCLVVVGVASAAEAALSTISRHRLNALLDDGERRAQALMKLLEEPYQVRMATLVLGTSATITATALTLTFIHAWSTAGKVASLVTFFLIWLTIGTTLPKTIATKYPTEVSLLIARPLRILLWLVLPVQWMLRIIAQPIGLFTGSKPQLVTEEELKLLVNVGEEEGIIESDEREMIEGIFEFNDTQVREVMVPRIDVKAIEVSSSIEEAVHLVLSAGHSRVPVYEKSIDQIIGVLYAKDLLAVLQAGRHSAPLRALMRTPFYVPDSMVLNELMKAMQTRKTHLAIIVDEYGGTAGLVTIEDLLEEIVGEIQDEYDVEEAAIEQVSPTEWIFNGRVPLDEVDDLTGLELDHADVDSIGGFVSAMLGTIPIVGDAIEVHGCSIEVLAVHGLRPHLVRLILKEASLHAVEPLQDALITLESEEHG